MKKMATIMASSLLSVSLISGCGNNAGSDSAAAPANDKASGKVELQFFQYKPEARDTFDQLIKKFEEQNPNIRVIQDNPPDASTVLKTKAAAGQIPDIIANGGDNVYAALAQSGVLADLSNAPELSKVQEAYIQILKDIAGTDKTYAIPYGVNANEIGASCRERV